MPTGELGLIFHWGLYSVPAFDSVVSARRRKTQNGSEWYYGRLIADINGFRPIAGSKETQQFHKQSYPDYSYDNFKQHFLTEPELWLQTVQQWMALAKEVGATYVILTAKHHDGYCLWPTNVEPHKQITTKLDILGTFADAAMDHGLRFGIYYSWWEFNRNITKDYLNNVIIPEINELKQNYNPDIWWFDGHWKLESQIANSTVDAIVKDLRRFNPGVEINDRIVKKMDNPNVLGSATYRVYEDRTLPSETPLVPWEHINTLGLSWGLNLEQEEAKDYKTQKQIIDLRDKVFSLGGKLLLNLGPDANGNLDQNEVLSLKYINC